jgi:hypothetical protein
MGMDSPGMGHPYLSLLIPKAIPFYPHAIPFYPHAIPTLFPFHQYHLSNHGSVIYTRLVKVKGKGKGREPISRGRRGRKNSGGSPIIPSKN